MYLKQHLINEYNFKKDETKIIGYAVTSLHKERNKEYIITTERKSKLFVVLLAICCLWTCGDPTVELEVKGKEPTTRSMTSCPAPKWR